MLLSFVDRNIHLLGSGGRTLEDLRLRDSTSDNRIVEALDLQLDSHLGNLGPSLQAALYLTRSYLEVLYDFSEAVAQMPLSSQLSLLVKSAQWPTDRFVDFAKYILAFPMAMFLTTSHALSDNPCTSCTCRLCNPELLPEKPADWSGNPLVFIGPLKAFLKNRIVSFSKKNASLCQGILQGVKRGCDVIPESYIRSSMLKHRELLTRPPPRYTWSDIVEDEPVLPIHFWLEAQVFYRNFRSAGPKLLEPSTSASFEAPRSSGGAREFIRKSLQTHKDLTLSEFVDPSDEFFFHSEDALLKMVERSPGEVYEFRGSHAPILSEVMSIASKSNTNVMVSGVLEPLKCRLITKGSSYRYWIAKCFQKELWSHLQLFPQFALTGRPANILDFYELLDREKSLGLDLPLWVSGDYSKATDGIDMSYSKLLLGTALDSAAPGKEYRRIIESTLYEQTLHYPSEYNHEGDLDPIVQTTGQLMGSIVSFPILCSLNLITYKLALQDYLGRSISFRQLPVLINGDDILFRCDRNLYNLWRKYLAPNFKLSFGKNYIHPNFFTINSQAYIYSAGIIKNIPFLNAGLLTGQSKITGRMNARMAPIWALYNETVHNALNPIRASYRFIHYYKDQINTATLGGNFNLFIPFWRGGLGFRAPEGFPFRITNFQRRFGYYLNQINKKMLNGGHADIYKNTLVAERISGSGIVRRHHYRFTLQSGIGPLGKDLIPFQDDLVHPPLLSEPIYTFEPAKLVMRCPKRVLNKFHSFYRKSNGVLKCKLRLKRLSDIKLQRPDPQILIDKRESLEEIQWSDRIDNTPMSDYFL